nr:HWE histidine kinase domain-containing protein [Mesorhizobium liriopis]
MDVSVQGMGALIESHAWAETSLGPVATWSEDFRHSLDICLSAPFPMAIWWGSDLVQLYNDPFRHAIGAELHATNFGKPLSHGWRTFWPLVAPAVEALVSGREKSALVETLPFLETSQSGASGSIFAMSLTPLRGRQDGVAGIMATCREVVPGSIVDQRRGTLVALDDLLSPLDLPEAVAARSCELLGLQLGLSSLFLVEVDEEARFETWPGWPASALKPDFGRLSDAALDALHGGRPCLLGSDGDTVLFMPVLVDNRLAAMLVVEGGEAKRETIGLLSEALKRIDICLKRARAHQNEQATARSLKAAIANAPPLLWRSKPRGHWFWSSTRWESVTGQTAEESHGQGWLAAFHPDDHVALRAAWTKAEEGTSLHATARLRVAKDAEYRWFQVDAASVGRGDQEQWFGSCTEVDHLWKDREAHKSALDEMHHLERSSLALVRAIARRSAEETGDASDLAMRLDGRLEALARIQGVLSREPQGEVGLDFLIAEELAAHGAYEDGVIRLEGPPVSIRQSAAQAVGLAIHELVSHAVQKGALLHDDGSIRVGWRIEHDSGMGELAFSWDETSEADEDSSLTKTDFTLLQKLLTTEIGARFAIEAQPRGFLASISVPLSPDFLHRIPA